MTFYEINFNARPNVEFALSTSTDKYKNIMEFRQNLIEITIFDGSDVFCESNVGNFTIPNQSVFILFPDLNCRLHQIESETISINTVSMYLPDLSFQRHQVEDFGEALAIINDPARAESIFLPLYMVLDNEFLHTTGLIKTLINYYIQNTAADYCHCLSKWYELVGKLSKMLGHLINENSAKIKFSSTYLYMTKAKKYISAHYCENIHISDVATSLGITPNYLSTIFKSDTGMTINEYINTLRVQRIRDLLNEENMTLERIAAVVGLKDIRYMQRMFKKYYGVSMQRCKMIDHEISLYHPKPWDVEKLTRDIYKQERKRKED